MGVYSNGLPEVILGKAIKQHNFNRDEIVAMTKRAIFTVGHTNDTKHTPESGCYVNRLADGAIQNHYCMLYHEEEHFGVGSTSWSPLARGVLTRPLPSKKPQSERQQKDSTLEMYLKNPKDNEIVRRVEEVAKKIGESMAQTALAWLMAKYGESWLQHSKFEDMLYS
ncbi:hypothetical protein FIBSPDRAFT_1041198 [Athelia psychrophila]|uniref:NADP-dependent oxidoreductase domain-containing protein n=1 Tax=Athelia psychrophila TaxID=1759441 RepID=A0A166P8G6_9AGAM|nr:hypothetical protein FIBSPDRAFT_1041198 [Fibularhizoctonia sp. CBS 109695]